MGSEILIHRFGYTEDSAGSVLTLPYLVIGLMMVPVSYLGDKLGSKKQLIVLISGFCTFSCTFLLIALPKCDNQCYYSLIPWICLGLN